jgi:hypothetical protein
LRTVRIFISSPGDVIPERIRAGQVIKRLAQRFSDVLSVEPTFWESEPLTAGKHFQANIATPSQTDAVVTILWSRLGTPLPKDQFPGRISGNQVTGTEWEFEDALGGYRDARRPELFVYVKKAPVEARFDDPDDPRIDAIRRDKRRLNEFLKTWFWDEKEDVLKGSQREFTDTSMFEEMLERHLERFLQRFIEKRVPGRRAGRWHRGSPFRGLQPFDVGHEDIFFGRTRARNELREMLVAQAERGSAFVAILGASGSGKSSLVRAGLIPDLVLPGMVPGVELVRYALLRPRDEDANPLAALAAALMSALPELGPLQYSRPVLEQLIAGSVAEATLPVSQGLAAARQGAQLSNSAQARLLIVVDQFEELFTLPIPEATKRCFVDALDHLARSSVAWIIATVRTDFSPQFTQLAKLADLTRNAGTFLLSPPSPEEVGQIILRPAEAAGLEYETDIRTGRRLDEELRRAAGNNPGALPLLEYLLERLWQERDADERLTFNAYTRLGGLEGAIGQRAEELFLALPDSVQRTLPEVLRALVGVAWAEGSPVATSKTSSLSSFGEDTAARRLVDALHAPNARLLVVDGDRVRVAHEALLVHWARAVRHISEDQRDLQARDRLEREAAEWQQGAADTQAGLLIPAGVRLSDAEDLLQRRGSELSPLIRDYIARSVDSHHTQQTLELERERERRMEAEQRQIRAEVAEKRAAAERSYARAERNRALARRVAVQKIRPDRKRYKDQLMQRATEFESQADQLWNAAYTLERKLGPMAAPSGAEVAAQPLSSLFDLDVITTGYRAGSFIVRYGDPCSPRLLVVEGGDRAGYPNGLKARLTALREQASPAAQLLVELVIVTHYDMDRVAGIACLLEELKEASDATLPPLAQLKAVWFNHFLPENMENGERRPTQAESPKEKIPRLASALGIELNEPFDYFVMASERGPTRVTLGQGMTATVIAPDAAWLQKWYAKWRVQEADRRGEFESDLVQQTSLDAIETNSLDEAVGAISEGFSSPHIELLRAPADVLTLPAPAQADVSVANLSSIVTLLEFSGRWMLFCGDSRCDHISRGLSQAGLLPLDGRLRLDVMQVPHAGSRRNITPEFFERVTADHYVIAPNRMFALPDEESLEMIVSARGDARYSIHLPPLAPMSWLDPARWTVDLRQRVVTHDSDTYTVSLS